MHAGIKPYILYIALIMNESVDGELRELLSLLVVIMIMAAYIQITKFLK